MEAYARARGFEGLGMGDVKMLAMIGAFLGWQLMLLTLVLASFAGSVIGVGLMATQRGGMKTALPFGTFLAVGALVAAVAGDAILDVVLVVLPMTTAPRWLPRIGSAHARADRAPVPASRDRSTLRAPAVRRRRARRRAQRQPRAGRRGDGAAVGGAAGGRHQAEGPGAGDERPRRGLGAVERPDRRQPHVRPAGRRSQRPRRDPEPGRPPLLGVSRDAAGPTITSCSRPRRRSSTSLPSRWRPAAPSCAALWRCPTRCRVSHLGVTVSPLANRDTEPGRTGRSGFAGIICLFADLTNVVELEEQLRLKDTLARLGELTAGIAHEFRNGLATIHGYSRLIDPDALPPQYQPYLEGIRQETEALGKVVTNFLNFARPEQVVFSRVDLGVIAARAADDLRHELPANTTIDVDGGLRRHPGGRCGAAADVQQPGAECRRSVPGCRHRCPRS